MPSWSRSTSIELGYLRASPVEHSAGSEALERQGRARTIFRRIPQAASDLRAGGCAGRNVLAAVFWPDIRVSH
jgi:hypothetical protein